MIADSVLCIRPLSRSSYATSVSGIIVKHVITRAVRHGVEVSAPFFFFVIFLLGYAVISACASRDQVEPTGNSKMADMTQSRNACLCGR